MDAHTQGAHNEARFLAHEFLVLAASKRVVRGVLDMVRMGEQDWPLTYGKIGRGRTAVLAGPWVNGFE